MCHPMLCLRHLNMRSVICAIFLTVDTAARAVLGPDRHRLGREGGTRQESINTQLQCRRHSRVNLRLLLSKANCEQGSVKCPPEPETLNFVDRRYRDVALNIRSLSGHACMLGCDTHMCEVIFSTLISRPRARLEIWGNHSRSVC